MSAWYGVDRSTGAPHRGTLYRRDCRRRASCSVRSRQGIDLDMEKREIPALTGLRGIAAYSVLIGHAIDLTFRFSSSTGTLYNFSVILAYFGMSCFFVLSGFVIAWNYTEIFRIMSFRSAVWHFMVARFARLYPLYVLAVIWGMRGLPDEIFSSRPQVAVAYFTMSQSWFNMQQSVFPPLWSISTEWFFYFVFIAVAGVLSRLVRPLSTLIAFMVFSFLAIQGIAALGFPARVAQLLPVAPVGADVNLWFWYFSPYVRVLEFFSGVFAARFVRSYLTRNANDNVKIFSIESAAIGWCCAVIVIGALWGPESLGVYAQNFIFAPGIVAVLIAVSVNSESPFGKILSLPWMVFAGEISYSVYLLQMWIMHGLEGIFPTIDPVSSVLKIASFILLTTCAAFGMYRLYEVPARRALRNVLMPQAGNRIRHPSAPPITMHPASVDSVVAGDSRAKLM